MILALDIGGTYTGWARTDLSCGTWQAPPDACHGEILSAWSDWLVLTLDQHPLVALAIEQPVFRTPSNKMRLVLGMTGVAHMEAWCRDIGRAEHMADSVRLWLLGFARVSPKAEPSKAARTRLMDKAVRESVLARGFRPDSEHAADAAALLSYVERMPMRELAA